MCALIRLVVSPVQAIENARVSATVSKVPVNVPDAADPVPDTGVSIVSNVIRVAPADVAKTTVIRTIDIRERIVFISRLLAGHK